MWIFFSDAMLSIVDKGGDGSTLLVRARIDREQVAQRIAEMVRAITYGNFKSSVREWDRHEAYLEVWRAMYDYQQADHGE